MISLGCYLYNHEDECGSRTELHLIQIRKQLNMVSQLNKFHYDSSRTFIKSSQVASRCSIKDRQNMVWLYLLGYQMFTFEGFVLNSQSNKIGLYVEQ